ncbi:MAG: hypothetical protein ABIR62_02005 [Dokdonella sp.]|uniref:hypothetical protein n=1 Tax=Dokdonella sp. TaxID=2291710 RepID=UPI00326703B8
MKRNVLFSAISATVLAIGFSASAGAQTCAAPASWTPDIAGTPTITDSTCGHETAITNVCQDAAGAPAAAYVALINVTAAGTFQNITFTGGAGYTYSAYFVPQASGCNANAACTTSTSGALTAKHANLPESMYYMIVTGADFDAPNSCGPFTATADGTLPVQLQSFSVS